MLDHRQIVKDFVSQWNTEKICQVMAFAEDGHMDYLNPCSCLIGVHSSDVLHDVQCEEGHYNRWVYGSGYRPSAVTAENSYMMLGSATGASVFIGQSSRDRVFVEILKEILAEREAKTVELEPALAASGAD
jgi:hypothetical protein